MARIEVHGDAPGEARAGDAQVLQTGIDEVAHHLVDAGARLEIVRVHQQIAHGLGIFRETEEIGLLLGGLDLAAAVGALAVLQLALRPERLARRAVHAGVFALVDVAVLIHLLEDALDGLDVVFVRGADEAVIGDVHQLPQIEHAALPLDDLVDELLRCDAGLLGAVLDLLAVLVRAGQEHHVIAAQALVARHGIRGYGAVGVADVELIRGIIDRRGDVKLFFFFFAAIAHGKSPSFLSFRICPLYPISGKIQAKTRGERPYFLRSLKMSHSRTAPVSAPAASSHTSLSAQLRPGVKDWMVSSVMAVSMANSIGLASVKFRGMCPSAGCRARQIPENAPPCAARRA